MKQGFLLLITLLFSFSLIGQSDQFLSSLSVSESVDGYVQLDWEYEPGFTYALNKKTLTETAWTTIALDIDEGQYIDNETQKGSAYEYQLFKVDGTGNATAYYMIYAGLEVDPVVNRGRMLLLVEESQAAALQDKIDRWILDTEADGWVVVSKTVPMTMAVTAVKAMIQEEYNAPGSLSSVFLLGHIPVPYSGNIVPDGHTNNHYGAWAADVYYAEMNESWTDAIVNTSGQPPRTTNIPGDGKFDQNTIVAAELELGRVDFFNMPQFPESETELLAQYLDKDHAFRNNQFNANMQAFARDNFGFGFDTGPDINFPAIVGPENYSEASYRNTLLADSYIWSYGAGPGSYTSAGNVSNTENMSLDSLQTVFTCLFGSYFGDWDTQNNFLRSALGSGTVLTNAWSGRPNWTFFHMGLGTPIGLQAKLTQSDNVTYFAGFNRMVHIALMGDPSLRMIYPEPLAKLEAELQSNVVRLEWEMPAVSYTINHYNIYYRHENDTAWQEATEVDADQNSVFLQLPTAEEGVIYFMVRPVNLEMVNSGSYYNQGLGKIASIEYVDLDEDGDGFPASVDCNDMDPSINPGAEEIINNDIDENCDGDIVIIDEDGDGFNSFDDCDDSNASVNPDAEEIPNNTIDEDCDGEALIIDEDGDGFNSDEDCNDSDPSINPDAEEIANNDVDEDCDGEALIIDVDGDGFNSDEDCDDSNAGVNPDATEIPNNDIDEDCDGEALMIDEDGDGFNSDEDCDDSNPDINPTAEEIPNNDIDEDCDGEALIIDEDGDGFNSDEDCDDSNAGVNPDAMEIPNNDIDEDCDGEALIIDEDGDGFNSDEDCNDADSSINPDAEEIPNNDIDEDCDGEALIIDEDGDGFNSDEDCDDSDPAINPDAEEIPNNDIDENCDGEALVIDDDGDGFNSDEDCDDSDPAINPDAEEIANNDIDEDCDGVALIIDEDGDGFNSDEDCDDMNADINPDAEEIANNGIDEDCDGEDLLSNVNVENDYSLVIYPNPTTDVLTISYTAGGTMTVDIYSEEGRRMLSLTDVLAGQVISLKDIPAGVYSIRVVLSGKQKWDSFIKL